MNKTAEFSFKQARKIKKTERLLFKHAYENTFKEKLPLRGRPPKKATEKYRDIHIKIHPRVLAWTHAQAKKRGIGYQSVINEVLLQHAG